MEHMEENKREGWEGFEEVGGMRCGIRLASVLRCMTGRKRRHKPPLSAAIHRFSDLAARNGGVCPRMIWRGLPSVTWLKLACGVRSEP
jgi:hypothetical protein